LDPTGSRIVEAVRLIVCRGVGHLSNILAGIVEHSGQGLVICDP